MLHCYAFEKDLDRAEALVGVFSEGRRSGRPRKEEALAVDSALGSAVRALNGCLRQRISCVVSANVPQSLEIERAFRDVSFLDADRLEFALRALGRSLSLDEFAAELGRPGIRQELTLYAGHLERMRRGGSPAVSRAVALNCIDLVHLIIEATGEGTEERGG